MALKFLATTITPRVRAAQVHYYGSSRPLPSAPSHDPLTDDETDFLAARDSFYMATVTEDGWPYVQHRGGPPGFLKVLGPNQLGFADFGGNRQMISTGNLAASDRVALFFMDYPRKERLKLLGHVRVLDAREHPQLADQLSPTAALRGSVERLFLIDVIAFDWNCPKYITPRFTEAEVAAATAPVLEELARLKAAREQSLGTPPTGAPAESLRELGTGPLVLEIVGIRQLTPRVRAYELRSPDGARILPVAPGAHLDVPVRLVSATPGVPVVDATRRYSITAVTPGGDGCEIAVQRDDHGSGGSRAVHRDYHLGMTLRCGLPGNDFPLHTDQRPAVLIAGGIGITPLYAMAQALIREGRPVTLHYAARSRREAPLAAALEVALGAAMTLYVRDSGPRLDVGRVLAHAPADSVFYVCGPGSLIEAVQRAAAEAGIAAGRVRFERFGAAPAPATDRAIRVTLGRSGRTVEVGASQSILDAVQAAGIDAPASCRSGTCGTCAAKVLSGEPEHRDSVLSAAERGPAGLMCICISRATSPELTLDL